MLPWKKTQRHRTSPAPTPPPPPERSGKARSRVAKKRKEKIPVPRAAALERAVRALYADAHGALPDLTHLEPVRSYRTRNILITATFFFAVLAAAAWAGFFIFQPYKKTSTAHATISLVAPQSAKSGEEVTVRIRYAAEEAVALASVEISITLPPDFILREATPQATGDHRWVIGQLPAGSSGEIVLAGTVYGAPGTLLAFQAFSSYVPENFHSPFQTVASAAVPIVGSLMEVAASSTERVLPGEPVSLVFSYRNTGSSTITDTAFRTTLPAGFVVVKTDPAPSDGGPLFWKIGKLEPSANGTIALTGTFSSDVKGALSFGGEIGFFSPGNSFVTQAATTTSVSVLSGDLVLSEIVNGSGEGTAVHFGDTLHTTFSYANRSEAQLEDVVLVAHLTGTPAAKSTSALAPVFDALVITDSAHGVFSTSTGAMTWTKKEIPALTKLAPGDEGTIDMTVRVAPKPTIPGAKEYGITLWLDGTIGKVNGTKKDRKVQSAQLSFPVLSDARFTASARYYNDDEITVGTGPLPPQAGTETTYRIFWTIENGLHEVQNLSLQTTLPENVRFTGKQDVSAGAVAFDEKTRTVTWTLNKLPVDVQKTTVDFEVGLTPSAAAVGNILPLTDTAHFDAVDALVGAHILKSEAAVDTSLVGDPLGRGKGVVTGE